ncbi:fimbrial protein [Pseudomonas azotoformans]|uniref:Fimbrial protein n=1 Tax=Pseudomonas azotoformans TaxID=47878 RepID=A0A1V2JED4_PSEAZ|nr:fimbrial protein [Pseudomonas azotoformans]OIN43552.1 fimbrial protein [Pseudomonas azotoformans]ONH43722.1 fimbrial protein [Pseudomonas azotoformans]SDO51410.1 Pilin (type 1 fimbria component protein) [Pseudomonas azotoformans]
MKHSITFISILLALGMPIAAHAACDRYPNMQHSVTFPNSTIPVPESLGVGQLITSQTFAGPYPTFYMWCPTATPTFLTGRFTSAQSAPGGLIYHTNVPGIGMRVMVTLTSGAPYSAKLKTESLVSAPGRILWGATRLVAEFYKLGPVTTGTLPSGEIQHNNWDGGKGHYRMVLNNSIRFVNPASTCDLAAGDVNRTIPLPTVRVSAFNNADSAGASNFELTATCSNASSVTFRFTGAPAPGNASLFSNTGTAGGVALWLYSRTGGANQTISNNGTRTVAVSGNRAVLPLGAAYHKNGTVRQGTLATTTTVNITYN